MTRGPARPALTGRRRARRPTGPRRRRAGTPDARDGLSAQAKTSVSDVVTAADHAAERLVVDTLATERPEDGVLGEEGSAREGRSGRTWVIDPSTAPGNFVAGLDWWCSAIALTDGTAWFRRGPPPRDRQDPGRRSGPADDRRRRPRASVDRPLAQSCLTTHLHPPYLDHEVGRVPPDGRPRSDLRMPRPGSMDAVAVAEGRLHVVCQHPSRPWDEPAGRRPRARRRGVTRRVEAAGVTWYAAGAPTAVAEVARARGLTAQRTPYRCSSASWSSRSKPMPRWAAASGSKARPAGPRGDSPGATVGDRELVDQGRRAAPAGPGIRAERPDLVAQDQVVAHAGPRGLPDAVHVPVRGGLKSKWRGPSYPPFDDVDGPEGAAGVAGAEPGGPGRSAARSGR